MRIETVPNGLPIAARYFGCALSTAAGYVLHLAAGKKV